MKRFRIGILTNGYFLRTGIEGFFKTAKDCLDILTLVKWNSRRIEGKILSDIISSAVYVMMRKKDNQCGLSMPRPKEVWKHFDRKQICGVDLSDYLS